MRTFITALLLAASLSLGAQTPKDVKYVFTEASDLNLTGKLFNDIPNPYHRVDTVRFKGFTKGENLQVRESSGIACTFRTNSSTISVKTVYGTPTFPSNTNGFSSRGYDLYIREGGQWVYAASGVAPDKELGKNIVLIKDMDPVEHECLLYLPLYSEVNSVQIGVEEGAAISGFMPFHGRVAVFGSSYTHGSSTSRAGMTYPAQFTRATGVQLLSLGCSGNCKLQDYFCDVLCAAEDIDAFVFDSFSNPNPTQMEERLFPFIEKLQKAHPGVPLIFQRTIRREGRNFSNATEAFEASKMRMADSLMAIAVGRYSNVYYISPDASAPDHNATVDGIHPDNYGYSLWERSVEKPLLKILSRYGLSQGPSMKVVVADGQCMGRFVSETKTSYVADIQDTYEVPKAGAKVVEWKAEDGKGVVWLTTPGKASVYSSPDTGSKVIATARYEEGSVPDTYRCIGYSDGWYRISIDGKTGYIQSAIATWDAIDTF